MESTDETRSVDVEVTLTGGVRHLSTLPAASPLLRDLYIALASSGEPAARHAPVLLQLPLDGGLASCSFMSTSLISVTTRPPVLVQSRPAEIAAAEPAPAPPRPPIEPALAGAADHVRLDDFLTPDENRQLLDYALASESEFEGSTVINAVAGHRRSRVLYAIERSRWRDIFLNRLRLYLPHIASLLNAATFPGIEKSEIQLTASNDGDFFKPHPDASPEQQGTASRRITYVYYFHRMPRPFEGGDLLLYGREPVASGYDSVRAASSIAPQNNCLIAFASDRWHEIDIIRCPSQQFADSRFTVNGWVHASA